MREGVWQGLRGGRWQEVGLEAWGGLGKERPQNPRPSPHTPHLAPPPSPQLLASLPLNLPPLGVSASLLCVCVCVVCQGWSGAHPGMPAAAAYPGLGASWAYSRRAGLA